MAEAAHGSMDKQIEKQIEEISGSAIEFRKSIEGIIFARLKTFFNSKGKEMARDSKLKDILGRQCAPCDWYELEDIGLRIPDLTRHKAFNYVMVAYVLLVIVAWIVVFFLTNLEAIFAVWTLPLGVVASTTFLLTLSPILGILAIFKERVLPVDTMDELIDGIIAKNWAGLLVNDKKLFKEILRQELTERQAQQNSTW